jgi:hypothetical protein
MSSAETACYLGMKIKLWHVTLQYGLYQSDLQFAHLSWYDLIATALYYNVLYPRAWLSHVLIFHRFICLVDEYSNIQADQVMPF